MVGSMQEFRFVTIVYFRLCVRVCVCPFLSLGSRVKAACEIVALTSALSSTG